MSKSGWVHRDKIKASRGPIWLTVPIKNLSSSPIINDAQIEKNKSYERILSVLENNYRTAPAFKEIFPLIERIFNNCSGLLIDLNLKLLSACIEWFDIKIDISFSSDLQLSLRKSEMNADIVHKVNGNVYLSGTGASAYHEQLPFDIKNIKVMWQNFKHPVYNQQFGDFISYLSAIDLFLNEGIESSRKIIRRTF
jgi:hypothetical protein